MYNVRERNDLKNNETVSRDGVAVSPSSQVFKCRNTTQLCQIFTD